MPQGTENKIAVHYCFHLYYSVYVIVGNCFLYVTFFISTEPCSYILFFILRGKVKEMGGIGDERENERDK